MQIILRFVDSFETQKNILDFSSKLKRDGFLFRTLMSKLLRVNFNWVFKKNVFEKLFLDTSIYFKNFITYKEFRRHSNINKNNLNRYLQLPRKLCA